MPRVDDPGRNSSRKYKRKEVVNSQKLIITEVEVVTAAGQTTEERMSIEERAQMQLHALYRRYGYSRYKMDKFEEYELYLQNRDFIDSEDIIAFRDGNGHLMALKPDLTLSIVKNERHDRGCTQKVFYSENIYRSDRETRAHREIMQTGLECIGDLDLYQIAEVTMLAAESLEAVSGDYVLQVSHMGVLKDLMRDISDDQTKENITKCIGEKNPHELRSVAEAAGVENALIDVLERLVSAYGSWEEVSPVLEKLPLSDAGKAALAELEGVFDVLRADGLDQNVRIDFSMVNDMTYYSGICFQGFVNGVPHSVLSGGEYDPLMKRMNKEGGAIGFAVYLDYLDRLSSEKTDTDVLLLYTEKDSPADVYSAASRIIFRGNSVLAQRHVPENLRYGRIEYVSKDDRAALQDEVEKAEKENGKEASR